MPLAPVAVNATAQNATTELLPVVLANPFSSAWHDGMVDPGALNPGSELS
jgi:hypothetical protein